MTERYRCADTGTLWTPTAVLERRVRVWHVASEAIGHPFSLLSAEEREHVAEHAAQLELRYGHDIAAQCEALRAWLRDKGETEAARWLHWGLCSSDVADGGLLIGLRDTAGVLHQLAVEAANAVQTINAPERWLFRTHGQAAVVGYGQSRWDGLALRLVRAGNDVREAQGRIELPGFAGPVGDQGILTEGSRRKIHNALGGNNRNPLPGSQSSGRGGIVAWAQAVSRLAGAAEQFGLTVRLLSQTGIDEVAEGRGVDYRGSSSMPHKHNPTQSERLCGIAPVVRGLVAGLAEAASSQWDAHSLEHSSAERIVIPQASELTGFMLTEVARIADNLRVNADAVRTNASRAPADSFREKNKRVVEGADGNVAWMAAKPNR